MQRRKRRRKRRVLPQLAEAQILAWAEAHHRRTGTWPNVSTGELYDDPNELWRGLDMDLRRGLRGLEGGTSLAQLLADNYGVRNIKNLPVLSISQILAWADAHYARIGRWPLRGDGAIHGAPGETWAGIQGALCNGCRGLVSKTSLSRLLAKHRGVRNHMDVPKLTVKQILAWADAHKVLTGEWPRENSARFIAHPVRVGMRSTSHLNKAIEGCRAVLQFLDYSPHTGEFAIRATRRD